MPRTDYIIDGERYPGVTDILGIKPKPWLDKWKAKWGVLAERKTACANAVGTAFHSGAERLSRHELVIYPANRRLGKMLERIDEWFSAEEVVPQYTELRVVSRLYKYAGTLDAVVLMRRYVGALVLLDYKTSSAIYEDVGLQLVAYAQAYYEQTGVRIKIGLIVHMSKDKPHHKLTVKEFKLNKALLNKFLKRLGEFNEVKR